MKNLLKVLGCLMLSIIVCGNNEMCSFVDYGVNYHTFNCTAPTLHQNLTDAEFFTITWLINKVEIECNGSPDFEKFNYSFRDSYKKSLNFSLKNCSLKDNTNLFKIAQLLNAEECTTISFKDTNKISTNKNLFQKFTKVNTLVINNINNLTNLKNDTLQLLPNLEKIYFTHNVIEHLPENIFKNLQFLGHLSLKDNKLKVLHPSMFRDLLSLKFLSLSYNNLISLPENIFKNNSRINKLNLKGNSLNTLPGKIFDKLEELEYLNIGYNNITQLPVDAFSGLKNTKTLWLKHNKLKTIPINIWRPFRKLKYLNLQNNQLQEVSISTLNILSLDVFRADNNLITTIDKIAFLVPTNITDISLSHNKIRFSASEINSAFSTRRNLKRLDLSFNDIQIFYNDWILLSNYKLKLLNLSHNKIEKFKIPHQFLNNGSFTIDLSYNEIKQFSLQNVERFNFNTTYEMNLDIRGNPLICNCVIFPLLRYINGKMNTTVMKKLKIDANLKCDGPDEYKGILLSDINIDEFTCDLIMDDNLPELCLLSCPTKVNLEKNLLILNCQNQNLTSAPENLCFVPGFETVLNLKNNFLTVLPSMSNKNYNHVKRLLLSGNQIKSLDSTKLSTNLEVLDLSDNLIEEINIIQLYFISKRTNKISLNGNPFLCHFNYTSKFKRDFNIQDSSNSTCMELKAKKRKIHKP